MTLQQFVALPWEHIWLVFGSIIINVEIFRSYNKQNCLLVKNVIWAVMCAVVWPFGFFVLVVRIVELAIRFWESCTDSRVGTFLDTIILQKKD